MANLVSEHKFSLVDCKGLVGSEDCASVCPILNFGNYLKKLGYDVKKKLDSCENEDGVFLGEDKDRTKYDTIYIYDVSKKDSPESLTRLLHLYKYSCSGESASAVNAFGPLAEIITAEFGKVAETFEKSQKALKESGILDMILDEES